MIDDKNISLRHNSDSGALKSQVLTGGLLWTAFLGLAIFLIKTGVVLAQGQAPAVEAEPTGKPGAKEAPYYVVVLTGDVYSDGQQSAGASESIRRYGAAEDGGLIRQVTFSSNYLDNPVGMARLIADLAADPKVRIMVVNQSVPGTAEGFRRVRAKRPDILLLAAEPHESPGLIARWSDLVLSSDFIARGYLIPYVAKQLGAQNLVHVSFERHLNDQYVLLRRKIMEEASKDLGLGFFDQSAPDPIGRLGGSDAKNFIDREFPNWLEQYGHQTAFFPTNDLHTEHLIRQIAFSGGLMIEGDIPSTLVGYPGAFELDFKPYLGQWALILKMLETKAVQVGAADRLGVWPLPMGYIQTAGLVEYGIRVVEGRDGKSKLVDIIDCLNMYSQGFHWNASVFSTTVNERVLRNFILVYQDTYILGRGSINTTEVEIPLKYYAVTFD
ncbi:MAG: DUF3798 domain-containing protein [Deltaproteobacteria bacterium]|jgi:hypothetical protein|nr:DUF3798 domain-containing protein [Deltaproteobacteria bacterium]